MATETYGENLLVNGSFEDVSYEPGKGRGHHRHHRHHHSKAELSGWETTDGPGPDVKNATRWRPSDDGNRFIELDGSGGRDTNSAISQDVPTGGTGTFQLSFSYAAPLFSRANSNGIEVIWNGEVIDTISADGGWSVEWQTFTYELEGAGDATKLEFRAVGKDDGRGGYLDNVSVVSVAPPPLFTEADDAVVLAEDDPDYGSGEAYDALDGDDTVTGGALDDEIFGNTGNDTLYGGDGNDILTGGSDTEQMVARDQVFEHDLTGLDETPTLGTNPEHFHLAHDHSVSLTFVGESAGYRNSVGVYKIAEDGTISDVQIIFEDASISRWGGTDVGESVDLSLSAGESFGTFIIANGASRNWFRRLRDGDFEFRDALGEPATIETAAPDLVFVDKWGRERDVRGDVYHSAANADNADLNPDSTVHVKSSLGDDGALRLSFEDLPSRWSDNDFDDVVIDLSFAPVTESILIADTDADVLFGEAGDDTLSGGAGKDELDGGVGNDVLAGGAGKDKLFGRAGDDELDGGAGGDTLRGGSGDDKLWGRGGKDELIGGGGDDILRGGANDDVLSGGNGDDKLIGGGGDDTIMGEAGDDVVVFDFGDGLNETADGGIGTDTLEITVETNDLDDPDVVNQLVDISAFILDNADAASDAGPAAAFDELGITVSNFEQIDITVIDSDTGEEVPGFLEPEIVFEIAAAAGDEDEDIALDITACVTDNAALFDVSVTISGLPAGAQLSAGTNNGDGSYTVDASDLVGLTMTPPADDAADFSLDVSAAAVSKVTGILTAADSIMVLDVTVDAVADGPILTAADATLTDPLAGDDILNGTEGKDTLTGSGGNDTISGGDGGDTLLGDGGPAFITGALAVSAELADTDGSELLSIRISGLPTGAFLSAGSVSADGSVALSASELSDLMLTTPVDAGNYQLTIMATATDTDPDNGAQSIANTTATSTIDVVVSADGDDVISGGIGKDDISGGGGNDQIAGDGGADQIAGDAGDDTIDGGGGDDVIDGGDGADVISGGGGDDTVFGGAGDDDINGGGGQDTLDGGDGDDIISGGNDNDSIMGGAGNDTLNGNGGLDVIDGGGGDDLISGGNDNDTITGGAGNDSINGNGGADILDGGEGDDIITGGSDIDTIDGGDGNDTIDGANGTDNLLGGAGDDTIVGGGGADVISGGAGNDTLNGNSGGDTIFGDVGEDTIYGDEGNDTLDGGDGNDELFGGDGKDVLRGGALDDRLSGEAGNDEMYGGDGNDVILGGEGNDIGYGGEGNDFLRGDAGNDEMFGEGGNDVLSGSEGKDTLHGGDGNDLLFGAQGGDVLYGDAGDDQLNGSGGGDVLTGGTGVDFMIGGGGSDRFVFDLTATNETGVGAGNRDIIEDFEADQASDKADVIELTGVVEFTFVGDETQAFTGTGASGRFNDQSKVLEIDSDGDLVSDMEIELRNVDAADLDQNDFSVI